MRTVKVTCFEGHYSLVRDANRTLRGIAFKFRIYDVNIIYYVFIDYYIVILTTKLPNCQTSRNQISGACKL